MKYLTFFVTFFAYLSIHIMRMSYSFNKSAIKQAFCIQSSLLGFYDAAIYLALGIGFFLRYKITYGQNIFLTYLKTSIIVAFAFSVIPLASLYNVGVCSHETQHNPNVFMKVIISISLILFGFFQFAHWPIMLLLVSRYFSPNSQGAQLGCWSAGGDVGNIVGFLLSTIIVINYKGRWEQTMIIASIFAIFMSLCVYFCINTNLQSIKVLQDQKDNKKHVQTIAKFQPEHNDVNTTDFCQYYEFVKLTIQDGQKCLYLASTALYKSILYGFLLWCPIFLVSINQTQFSGLIPMIFNFSTLVGSIILGKLYEKQKQKQYPQINKPPNQTSQNKLHFVFNLFKKYKIFVFSIFLIICFVLFINVQQNAKAYAILSFLMGFLLGGIFNVLITHEVLTINQNQNQNQKENEKNSDLMTTLTMSIGNTLVGCLQLIIGIVLHHQNKNNYSNNAKGSELLRMNKLRKHQHQKQNYIGIFVILLIVTILATVISFVRIYRSKQQEYYKNKETYDQGDEFEYKN